MSDRSEKNLHIPNLRIPVQPAPVERFSLMRTVKRQKKDHKYLTLNPGKKPYTILFNGDNIPQNVKPLQLVHVDSAEQACSLLKILGDTGEIFLSKEFRLANPGIHACIKALLHTLPTDQQYVDAETAAALMTKIPFDFKTLLQSTIALSESDLLPEPIIPVFVHKKNVRNVLISEPFMTGKLIYFNMFGEIDEFSFDHESDHLQGMLILEAMRQASLAVAHVQGSLPLGGGMTLLSYDTNFYNYVEKSSPVVIRAYSSFKSLEKNDEDESYAVCQVFQWGKLCAAATLKAGIFRSLDAYATHRIRSGKINERIKRQYDAKMDLVKNNSLPA
ncbi:MAG: hypothetical protein HGB36_04570 [Chlorobiaceae bacterium]|nr:hypothetical protein [Chlorobiaceae bacterium]